MGNAPSKCLDILEYHVTRIIYDDPVDSVEFVVNRGELRAFSIYALYLFDFAFYSYIFQGSPTLLEIMKRHPVLMNFTASLLFVRCFCSVCWEENAMDAVGASLGLTAAPSLLLLQFDRDVVVEALKATTKSAGLLLMFAISLDRRALLGPFLVAFGFGVVLKSLVSGFANYFIHGLWTGGPQLYTGVIAAANGILSDELSSIRNIVRRKLRNGQELRRIPFMSCMLFLITIIITFIKAKTIQELSHI